MVSYIEYTLILNTLPGETDNWGEFSYVASRFHLLARPASFLFLQTVPGLLAHDDLSRRALVHVPQCVGRTNEEYRRTAAATAWGACQAEERIADDQNSAYGEQRGQVWLNQQQQIIGN